MRSGCRSRGSLFPWPNAWEAFATAAFSRPPDTGVLVYRTADTDSQLTWFDRLGTVIGRASEPGGFRDAALSQDGARAVASRTNPEDPTKADLWLLDLSRGSGATRLTLGADIAEFPVWSTDGQRIVFTLGNYRLLQKLAGGEGDEEEMLRSRSAGIVKPFGCHTTIRSLCRSCGRHSTKWKVGSRRTGDGLPTSRTSPA
jgi:hypothetical protein